jgi:hypothetical protein
VGPLPALQTLRDKEPFYRSGGNSERTGDCPWAWALELGNGFLVPTPRCLMAYQFYNFSKADKPKRTVKTSPRLGSSSWTISDEILARFIVLEQLVQGLHLGHPIQTELLEIPSQGSSPARAYIHRAGLAPLGSAWPLGCSG